MRLSRSWGSRERIWLGPVLPSPPTRKREPNNGDRDFDYGAEFFAALIFRVSSGARVRELAAVPCLILLAPSSVVSVSLLFPSFIGLRGRRIVCATSSRSGYDRVGDGFTRRRGG